MLLLVANGAEDIETITVYDTLKRANAEVKIAKVSDPSNSGDKNSLSVKMMMGSEFVTHAHLEDIKEDDFNMVVLPGGTKGAKILAGSEEVKNLLKNFKKQNKFIGAICASPALVL